MSYSLQRLAPGSYDVLLDGEVVAALVKGGVRSSRWFAELLTGSVSEVCPAPFTHLEHEFGSLSAACAWLGASLPRGVAARP